MTPFAAFSKIKKGHLLAPYTTFRCGGPADYFYDLTDIQELPLLITEAKKLAVPFFILGAGSNTLFHDAGVRGLVIHISAARMTIADTTITAEAGASMHTVCDAAKKASLSGFEPFAGLPGTVGGAVRGNAGCFGMETKDVITNVTLFSMEKGFFMRSAVEMAFGYRTSFVKDHPEYVVCSAIFQLQPGNRTVIVHKMADILALRKTKQPPGPSAGSWFKNPSATQSSGYLLDASGCKGLTIGGAKISPHHANFFMNTGAATTADLLALSEKAKELVQAKFGILLENEVKIVPELI